jgi:low temperature requirement protein LtrA
MVGRSGFAMVPRWRTRPAVGVVTPSELFFDLVFVFVIIQATHQIEAHPDWAGVGHALLPLALVWWMFLGFGWLTNAVRPDSVAVRLLLILAMMAFFVAGLALPFAFERDGLAFPLAYLAAVAIHTAVFLTASEPSARRGILRIAPLNAGAGLLVLLAVYLPEAAAWWVWGTVVVLLYSSFALGRGRGFVLEPHHFVERHGVIMLIVLGESILALGLGSAGVPVDGALVAGAVLGISLAAGLWWIYFDGDEERAVKVLADASPERRLAMAFNAFAIGHIVLVSGVVLIAAGIHDAIHHLNSGTHSWLLGAGTAAYLFGHALHRAMLGTGRIADRVVAGVLAVPLGAVAAGRGWTALVAVTVLLGVVAVLDHRAGVAAEKAGKTEEEAAAEPAGAAG